MTKTGVKKEANFKNLPLFYEEKYFL